MTLRLAEDHDRIVGGLDDIVARRLFSAGPALEAVLGLTGEHRAAGSIQHAISELDLAIRDFRNVLFDHQQPDSPPPPPDSPCSSRCPNPPDISADGLMNRPGRHSEMLPHPPDLPRPLQLLQDLAPQRPPFVLPGVADDRSFQGQHRFLHLCQLSQRLVPRGDRLIPLDLPGQATDGDDILHRNTRHAYFETLVGTPERKAGQVGDADRRKLPKGAGRHDGDVYPRRGPAGRRSG